MNRYAYTAVFPSGARYAITKSAYDGWWSCSHAHRNGGAGSLAAIRRNVEDWGGTVERKQNKDWKPKTTTKEIT